MKKQELINEIARNLSACVKLEAKDLSYAELQRMAIKSRAELKEAKLISMGANIL